MRTNSKVFYSIRWSIVIFYMLITLFAFAVVLFSVSRIVEGYLVRQRINEQQQAVDILAQEFADDLYNAEAGVLYRAAVDHGQRLGGRIIILDTSAVVQVDGFSRLNGTRLEYPEVAQVLWGDQNDDYGFHQVPKTKNAEDGFFQRLTSGLFPQTEWVVYYASAIVYEGQKNGALFFSTSIQDVKDRVSDIASQVALVFGAVAVAAVALSFVMAASITRPIGQLTSVIRRMSRGEFNQRVKITGRTELAELSQTFNDMSEKLENIEKFRSEFVSNASHEIKTPLATMKILIESLLYQEPFDEGITREFLGDVNSEIDRLNLVISDLLRLVQIDKTETELKLQETRLDKLCSSVAKRLLPIANQKEIKITSNLSPVTLSVDTLKIEQVVFNLLDNAIKYTDNGGKVQLRLLSDGDFARIEVQDNGIGIPAADQPHVFERFYRVDKARSRQTGGTGLGLSIVEKIVKLHGGDILVKSEEGKGTTFTVILPIKTKN